MNEKPRRESGSQDQSDLKIGSRQSVLSTEVIWPDFFFQKVPLTLLEGLGGGGGHLASAADDGNQY